jgi:methionyl-tRNA formyltransferase
LVEKLDAGDVLLQKSTPIEEDDTAQSLHDRLSHLGAELILPTIQGLADNQLQRQPQEEAKVTYASKLSKEMEWLDPSESAATLDRRIRALFPWPGTSVNIAKQRLKIKRAKARRDIQGPAGQIFERAGMILMGTASGSLELQLLQWEGKKEVDPMGFLNGLKGKGQTLPLQCDQKSQI